MALGQAGLAHADTLALRHSLALVAPQELGKVLPRASHSVEVYFPAYQDAQSNQPGHVYRLSLRLYQADEPALYESPECFWHALGADWLEVINSPYRRYFEDRREAVVWSLSRVWPNNVSGGGPRTLSGKSHTAAVCIAFQALAQGQAVDARCLTSAQFKDASGWGAPNPPLTQVAGELKKAEGALAYGQFNRFLIARDSAFAAGSLELRDGQGRSIRLVRCRDLHQAYKEATGLAALEAYLQAEAACVAERIRRFRSPRLKGANGCKDLAELLTAMHVPFNVLTRVPLPRDDRRTAPQQAAARAPEPDERRHAPPGAPERLAQEEREHVRPFDHQFAAWSAGWAATPGLQVVLADPGYRRKRSRAGVR